MATMSQPGTVPRLPTNSDTETPIIATAAAVATVTTAPATTIPTGTAVPTIPTTSTVNTIPTTTASVPLHVPKTLRGLNKPKCSKCGNVARSRCPYQSCKSCCAKAQNPCHIHVLKSNTTNSDKQSNSSSHSTDKQPTDASSPGTSLRVSALRQLSQLNGSQAARARRPLTRKEEAAAINRWRFSKLKEYRDKNIETENEAFDRYMLNVSLLEEAFSVQSSLEIPAIDEPVPKPAIDGPATEPATDGPAPDMTSAIGPGPKPAVDGPALIPAVNGPAPIAAVDGPAPIPAVDGPASIPAVDGPAPISAIDGPAPIPAVDGPAPIPAVDGPAPKPTIDAAPELTSPIDVPAPKPTIDAAPEPSFPIDVPAPKPTFDAAPELTSTINVPAPKPTIDGPVAKPTSTNKEDDNVRIMLELKSKLRSSPWRTDSFRKRIRDTVDRGLRKLQKSECSDEGIAGDDYDLDPEKEVERLKKTKYVRAERLSVVNDLMEKLKKARNEDDLKSCLRMQSQLFGEHEKTSIITKSQVFETSDEQTVEKDPVQRKVPFKWLNKVEVSQETLNAINNHFSSLEDI